MEAGNNAHVPDGRPVKVQTNAQWAVVTGASSGLGLEFATLLAARSVNLVLVARREAPMQELASTLRARHGIDVMVNVADLGEPNAAALLAARLDARGIEADILINNAAFGLSGKFVEHDAERLHAMLQLGVVAMTELSYQFGQRMAARGHGRMLLVASIAALQPTPLLAAYGATKAYVLSLGEALNVEMAPVGVTVLLPGFMHTGFGGVADFNPPALVQSTALEPALVAQIGLDAMFAGKSSVVAGALNRFAAFFAGWMPRHLLARLVFRFSKG